MKKHDSRLIKLEQKSPPYKRMFIAWEGNPWTSEQKAVAMRLAPTCRIFWRSLLANKNVSSLDQKAE
jgi:hypothetical protein